MNKRKYRSSSLLVLLIGMFLVGACGKKNEAFSDRKVSFNSDWSFHLNDSLKDNDTISTTTAWRNLDLPHDWSIEGKFDKKAQQDMVVERLLEV